MQKKLKKGLVSFFLMTVLVLTGLNLGPVQVRAAAPQYTGTHYEDGFDTYDTNAWHIADGYSNGDMFNCTWRADNVVFNSGIMEMSIKNDSAGGYSGGEYRTNHAYHYGMYQVNMKPVKNDGVVTSFFTYTGPSDGTNWDEIDIEFLGKDTTKVQFNYYTNGVGGHEKLYDLGFDASQGYHTYGFYWAEDYIAWYVDGVEVYRTPASDASIIPDEPSRIMMNVWPGIGVDDWLNPYNGRTPLTGYYDWMSWDAPTGVSGDSGSDNGTDDGTDSGTGSDNEPGAGDETTTITDNLFTGNHYASGLTSYEDKMQMSDGWSNGSIFDCTWDADNISFADGKMDFSITNGTDGKKYSGEYRTKNTFGYGYYQVNMKPIKDSGVATSFLVYAGAEEGVTQDEIDITFAGDEDTTKVTFKSFNDGAMTEQEIALGFDASADYHTYAFNWSDGAIEFLVDGISKATITENVPNTPGKIIMNTWVGTSEVSDWLGDYDGSTSVKASYDWFAYDAPETSTPSIDNFDDNKLYKIISKVSDKALDVYYGDSADGTNVLQYTYGGNANQKWYLRKQDNGYYTIENYATGKVLMVEQSSISNGANVYQWTYNGSASQEWSIYDAGDGYCKIVNRNSEKVLDVTDSSTEDNANIQQWMETSGSDAYKWKIEELTTEEQVPQTELIYLPLEAELFTIGNNATIQAGSNLSNEYQVGDLGNTSNGTATLTLDAKESRIRGIKIYYSSVLNRNLGIKANDNSQVVINCAGYGSDWYAPAATPATANIELQEGENTIVFGGVNDGLAPNLDRIELELTAEEAQTLVQNLIDKLPEEKDITAKDKMTIKAVETTYTALADKENINTDKLTVALARLGEIENENLNVDTNNDGKADMNLDINLDGKADLNIDTNGDNIPDINIDIDDDNKADVNIDTNGDSKADINIDTNGDNIPDINIDTDNNGEIDINIDTDNNGEADINIDTNDDGRADLNIDTNGDGAPNVNVDTNGDGEADLNVDTDGDTEADLNVDTNGDGKADLNVDTDGDTKADLNVDTDGDGKADADLDTTEPPCIHSNRIIINQKEESCKEAGYTGDLWCEDCDTLVQIGNEIDKLTTHSWGTGEVTTPATETTDGVMTYHCTICGDSKTESIPATGEEASCEHSNKRTENQKEPSCKEAGYTGDIYCANCDELIQVGDVIEKSPTHSWGTGEVTTPATETTDGVMTYHCTVCGDSKTESIPATGNTTEPDKKPADDGSEESPAGDGETEKNGIENAGTTSNEIIEGSSAAQATQVITSNKTEDDLKGSTFATLSLRVEKATKKTQKLKWNKVKGADGYMIFGNKCGKQMKLLKTITKGKTTSWTRKNIKKNTYYKYLILAYKVVDGEKITLCTSKTVHVPTTGGKYCDIKSVKVNKSKVTLKKGKTFTIKAKEVKVKSKQKIKRHRKIYFESTNAKVATVSTKGKITAKKKGTCYVYAYAQNGVFKKIKVTVK